jgi:hypothetical protein
MKDLSVPAKWIIAKGLAKLTGIDVRTILLRDGERACFNVILFRRNGGKCFCDTGDFDNILSGGPSLTATSKNGLSLRTRRYGFQYLVYISPPREFPGRAVEGLRHIAGPFRGDKEGIRDE